MHLLLFQPQEQVSGTCGPPVTVVVDPDGAELPSSWLLVPEDIVIEVVPSSILETVDSLSSGERAANDRRPSPVNPEARTKTCHRQLPFFQMGSGPKTPVSIDIRPMRVS